MMFTDFLSQYLAHSRNSRKDNNDKGDKNNNWGES